MASPRTSRRTSKARRAFTLIEVVTVIGIITVLTGMTLVLGIDGLRGYTFRADRDIFVSALQRARAQAMGNVCLGTSCTDGKVHGVALDNNHIVIFQGPCYLAPCVRDPADDAVAEILDTTPTISYTGTVQEIVFGQLSGTSSSPTNVPEPWIFTLSDSAGRVSAITIEREGRILWTH